MIYYCCCNVTLYSTRRLLVESAIREQFMCLRGGSKSELKKIDSAHHRRLDAFKQNRGTPLESTGCVKAVAVVELEVFGGRTWV